MIVGIDEVGRGSLAGPVVVAACLLGDITIDGLTDSKILSKKKRVLLDRKIKKYATSIGIGWVSAKMIDTIGISGALKLAAEIALNQIDGIFEQIIVDGTIRLVNDPRAITMKKADLLISSVSAASIIAKVARDQYMYAVDPIINGYGFSGHVGYGAAKHMEAITRLGPSLIHRMSFAPMNTRQSIQRQVPLTSGQMAEQVAAEYLQSLGYTILERNWKTRVSEVDIIAKKAQQIYFVEVKYRISGAQGGGIAAITPKKVHQMKFAAELWLARYGSISASLSALEISGKDFTVTNFVEQVQL